MVAILEDQLPSHLALRVLSHHHDIGRIASIFAEASLGALFGECIKRFGQAGRIPALIRTDLDDNFRHPGPDSATLPSSTQTLHDRHLVTILPQSHLLESP